MNRFLLSFAILICIQAVPAFAWEPADLMSYPKGMEAGDFILNTGIGFDIPEHSGSGLLYIPPIHASLDYNLPLGDKKLPFFIGGVGGYSAYGHGDDWFYNKIYIGGRLGYHFNWDVKNLDTYAVATAGWIVYVGDGIPETQKNGWPLVGVNIGARYFFNSFFGIWAVAGYSISLIDLGLCFRF